MTPDEYYNATMDPLPKPPANVRLATEDDMHTNGKRIIGRRFYSKQGDKWTPHTLNRHTDAPSLKSLIKLQTIYVDDPPQIMYT